VKFVRTGQCRRGCGNARDGRRGGRWLLRRGGRRGGRCGWRNCRRDHGRCGRRVRRRGSGGRNSWGDDRRCRRWSGGRNGRWIAGRIGGRDGGRNAWGDDRRCRRWCGGGNCRRHNGRISGGDDRRLGRWCRRRFNRRGRRGRRWFRGWGIGHRRDDGGVRNGRGSRVGRNGVGIDDRRYHVSNLQARGRGGERGRSHQQAGGEKRRQGDGCSP
jgi:hypothetical protein